MNRSLMLICKKNTILYLKSFYFRETGHLYYWLNNNGYTKWIIQWIPSATISD